MYKNKVQLKIFKNTLQPSIAILKLTENEYKELEAWKQNDNEIYLAEDKSNLELSCQICSVGMEATPEVLETEYNMFILLDQIEFAEDEKLFIFSIMKRKKEEVELPEGHTNNPWAKTTGVFLDNQECNGRTIVSIEGNLFTRYLYSKELLKPYYYPLIGPKRKTLVQDAPDDHLHHHGMWWGHDGVNGHQVYHEFRGEGRQSHRKFLAHFGGTVVGQITAVIDWLTAKGDRLLQETRTMRIYNLPNEARYFDVISQLHATEGEVEFSNTKEGGFPFIRVNEQINALHNGKIVASTGKIGEEEIFGSEADWVDYSGKILEKVQLEEGVPVKKLIETGIAILLHPKSDDYPAKWFVRNYGPVTSSNFHFTDGYKLAAGSKYTFRQRIYIHKGNSEEACIEQRYGEYKNPLTAEWEHYSK